MATKHHNYVGPPTLHWEPGPAANMHGVHWIAQSWRPAKYHMTQQPYTVKSNFAYLRPAHDANGLYSARAGWVVSRGGFEDLAHYPSIDEAKLYVEALFALETS
jgi:hypothetical protein